MLYSVRPESRLTQFGALQSYLLSDIWSSSQREPVAFPAAFLSLSGHLLPVKTPVHMASGLRSHSWSPRQRTALVLRVPRDISGVKNAVGASSGRDLAPF